MTPQAVPATRPVLVQVKRQYPDKLIAMQIGDFFEFAGWDTVMVIEALGLKGMGLGTHLPPAQSYHLLPAQASLFRRPSGCGAVRKQRIVVVPVWFCSVLL